MTSYDIIDHYLHHDIVGYLNERAGGVRYDTDGLAILNNTEVEHHITGTEEG